MRPTTRKAPLAFTSRCLAKLPPCTRWACPSWKPATNGTSPWPRKSRLNQDRNNVKTAYLKAVRTLVLNEMRDRLTEEDANADWVRQASSDPACSEDAIKKVLNLRFGDKFAAFDPNDPEANKKLVAEGGHVGLRADAVAAGMEEGQGSRGDPGGRQALPVPEAVQPGDRTARM